MGSPLKVGISPWQDSMHGKKIFFDKGENQVAFVPEHKI